MTTRNLITVYNEITGNVINTLVGDFIATSATDGATKKIYVYKQKPKTQDDVEVVYVFEGLYLSFTCVEYNITESYAKVEQIGMCLEHIVLFNKNG